MEFEEHLYELIVLKAMKNRRLGGKKIWVEKVGQYIRNHCVVSPNGRAEIQENDSKREKRSTQSLLSMMRPLAEVNFLELPLTSKPVVCVPQGPVRIVDQLCV